MGAPAGGVDGLAFLEQVVVVLVPQLGPAVPGDGGDGGIEDDGDEAAGEAVVVEVQPRHRAAGLEDQGGVDEARQNAVGPAKVARDGGQGGAEQPCQLEGGIVGRVVHPVSAQGDAHHHRQDVERVLAESGEAHDGKNSAQSGAVQVAAHGEDVQHPNQAVDTHIDEYRPRAEHTQVVAGSPAGGG